MDNPDEMSEFATAKVNESMAQMSKPSKNMAVRQPSHDVKEDFFGLADDERAGQDQPLRGAPSKRHFAASKAKAFLEIKPTNELASTGSKRNLDTFLDELKRETGRLEERKSVTNGGLAEEETSVVKPRTLQLTSLPVSTTERILRDIFEPFGPLTGVNVIPIRMGARSAVADAAKKGISAYVTFELHEDAVQAKTHVNGRTLNQGWRIHIQWGKDVSRTNEERSSMSALSVQPFGAMPEMDTSVGKGYKYTPPQGLQPYRAKIYNSENLRERVNLEVRVIIPSDIKSLRRIHGLIETILRHGPIAEAIVMTKEKNNSDFNFLYDYQCQQHIYYRWKLYSLLNGDTPFSWKRDRFQMFSNMAWWIPPSKSFYDDAVNDENNELLLHSSNQPANLLGPKLQRKYEWMLRDISYRRGSIARAMAFAIQHADAADEIVQVTVASLKNCNTPVSRKVARLWLVSDILHNASSSKIPNVWQYRNLFERHMVDIFKHLSQIYTSLPGRIKADNFRRQIETLVKIWEGWIVISHVELGKLMTVFLNGSDSNPAIKMKDVIKEGSDEIEKDEEEDSKPIKRWKKSSSSWSKVDNANVEISSTVFQDENLDGLPLEDDSTNSESELAYVDQNNPSFGIHHREEDTQEHDKSMRNEQHSLKEGTPTSSTVASATRTDPPVSKRVRMKASDMFQL